MKAGDIVERKYELIRLLGKGGMGEVWEGRHVKIGRRVALKFLHESLASEGDVVIRFLREAQAAAAIGSEHIVDIYDLGDSPGGAPFLVMEYLEGEDLGAILKRKRRLKPDRAVNLVIQACHGLAAAHDCGIIHRDLKPDNLFRTQREGFSEWIKIVDFGIAKFRDSLSEVNPRLTETGMSMGTPYYMSAEQAKGESDIDHRTDIYSVGVILYELIAGRVPYTARSYSQLIYKMATEAPQPPRMLRPSLSPELDAVILRAMARERRDRYDDIMELAKELEPFCTEPRILEATPSMIRPSGAGAQPKTSKDPDQVLTSAARHEAPTKPSGKNPVEGWDAPTRPSSENELEPPASLPEESKQAVGDASPASPRGGNTEQLSTGDSKSGTPLAWRSGQAEVPVTAEKPVNVKALVAIVVAVGLVAGIIAAVTVGGESTDRTDTDGTGDISSTASLPAKAEPSEATVRDATTEDAESALVTITLDEVPEGARVFLDETPVEGTELHLKRSAEMRKIKVTLEGRAPWERLVSPNEDRRLKVALPASAAAENTNRPEKIRRPQKRPVEVRHGREDVPAIRTQFPGGNP